MTQQTYISNNRLILGSYILIGIISLALRTADLGSFANEDEVRYWLSRSQTFLNALQTGDFGATAITTHPGVTTMWLGSVGILLRRALRAWHIVQEIDFPLRLALMRLPVVLVHTGGVLFGYAMLRRMLPPLTAALAALLWATDPFVLAFSRVLHVDGLAMTFATLSILAGCLYWYHNAKLRWWILSGVFAALAILSKSPALVLGAVAGGMALLWILHAWRTQHNIPANTPPALATLADLVWTATQRLLLWGSVLALTMVIVWPSFWVDPMRVYTLMRVGVEVEGGSPHVQGNYFLGREDNEPGMLFYPVALALRTTPWSLAGLLLLPWAMGLLQRSKLLPAPPTSAPIMGEGEPPHPSPFSFVAGEGQRMGIARRGRGLSEDKSPRMQDIALLAGYALLFVVGLSLFPKKLNRYLIPIFPTLDILATVGLVWGIGKLQAIWQAWRSPTARFVIPAAATLLALAALFNAIWYHPYGIAYFNQVLGGPRMGAWAFLIGHGEGLEQVAAFLNAQPDTTGVVTVTTMPPPLQLYLKHGAYAGPPDGDKLPDKTGYVAIYVRNVWGVALPPFDQFYQRKPTVFKVTIHGVAYAWVYQVPRPLPHQSSAQFGEAIGLHSYAIDSTAVRSSGTLSVTTQWEVHRPVSQDVMLFVHVFNEAGEKIAQIDVPPGGADRLPTTWHPNGYVSWVHPVPLPADLPNGQYFVTIGLYEPSTFARLPLSGTDSPHPAAPDDGEHALVLPKVVLGTE